MNGKILFSLLMGIELGLVFLNIPPAINSLMALYGISYTGISWLISAILWSHSFIQIPGGMVTDRLGIKRSLMVSLILLSAGNLLPAMRPSFGLAVLGRIASGLGTGISFVSTMKLVALYAPKGRAGTFQSFFAGFFSLGSILSYLLIPLLLVHAWQWAYLLPGLLGLPLILWVAMLPLDESGKSVAAMPLKEILTLPIGWVLGIYHALSYGSMINLGSWVPSLLAETLPGRTAASLAWGGALVMLISGVGRLGGGFILLRIRPELIANGTILIVTFLCTGLFLTDQPSPVLVLSLTMALFASINFGAFFHLASRATPPGSLATLFGFVNLIANLGAILFTLMFGWVKDVAGSFSYGFAVLALGGFLAYLTGRAVIRRSAE
jgi:MFS family permease